MNVASILQNLAIITGGDPALDCDLLETFVLSSRDYLKTLQEAQAANNADLWQRTAHALKGGCFNLGINDLGALADMAQKQAQAAPPARAQILQSLNDAFAKLEPAILTLVTQRKAG